MPLLIKGAGGVDTSDAYALPQNIETGCSAYVKGEKIVGTKTPMKIFNEVLDFSTQDSIDGVYYYIGWPDHTPLGLISANCTGPFLQCGEAFYITYPNPSVAVSYYGLLAI